MAKGRFINYRICMDKKVAGLQNDTDRLCFTWLITTLDRDGRQRADARIIRSMLFPMRPVDEYPTIDNIAGFLEEWHEFGLIELYEDGDETYMWFPKFLHNQKGGKSWYHKESTSDLPPPPGYKEPFTSADLNQNSKEPYGKLAKEWCKYYNAVMETKLVPNEKQYRPFKELIDAGWEEKTVAAAIAFYFANDRNEWWAKQKGSGERQYHLGSFTRNIETIVADMKTQLKSTRGARPRGRNAYCTCGRHLNFGTGSFYHCKCGKAWELDDKNKLIECTIEEPVTIRDDFENLPAPNKDDF